MLTIRHVQCTFRRLLVAALLALGMTLPVIAQEIRQGNKVTVIHWNTGLKAGDKVVAKVGVGTNLDVDKVNGDWLWIASYKGYVKRADVVPYDQAVQHFTARIRANPNDNSAYHDRAYVWNARGEHDIAIKDFTEAIRLNPDSASYFDRGLSWETIGEADKAIADYSEVIRLNPSDVNALIRRGIGWKQKKEFDRALADFTEVIRLAPVDATSWRRRAGVYLDRYQFPEAKADYDESIRLMPTDGQGYQSRGWMLRRQKDYRAALSDAERCMELDFDDHYGRGVALYHLHRCPEAIKALELAVAGSHGDAARAYLALCRSTLSEFRQAKDDFRVLVATTDVPMICRLLFAQYLASCPNSEYRNGGMALEQLQAVKDPDSRLVDVHDIRAMAQAECGDFAAAIASQKEAIALAESRNYHADYIAGLRERLNLYEAGQPYRHPVFPAEPEKKP